MTNQQQYEQTWDMRKKYEAIVKIVKSCEEIINDSQIERFQRDAHIHLAYFDIKDIIEDDLK